MSGVTGMIFERKRGQSWYGYDISQPVCGLRTILLNFVFIFPPLLLFLFFTNDDHKIICSVYAASPVFIYDVGILPFCDRAAASVFVYVLVAIKKRNEVKRTFDISPH